MGGATHEIFNDENYLIYGISKATDKWLKVMKVIALGLNMDLGFYRVVLQCAVCSVLCFVPLLLESNSHT